jgi:hypothetical protein
MIAHVVLFRPSRSLTPDARDAFVGALERALAAVPGVHRARVGRRRNLGRYYDQNAPDDYSFAAVLEFASEDALRSYLDHPAHAELGQRFFASAEAALVHDFEWTTVDKLRSLIEDGDTPSQSRPLPADL